jgi:predicted alpha-1,2-mannosidase
MRRGVLLLCLAACAGDNAPPPPLPEVDDPLLLVDPTIGAGGLGFAYGSAFVGAAWPHGLVKLGPDTNGAFGTIEFQHFSGYFAEDDRIQGFSHLHLHGAGVSDLGVLSVMPTRAFDPARTSVVDYEARFAKADERAAPGAYQVTLDSGIAVTLVATLHGAHEVFEYGAGGGTLVIDLDKSLAGTVDDASITVDAAARTITGMLHHRGGMSGSYGGYDLWFAARTDVDFTAETWARGAAITTTAETLQLQLAVSLVSAEGARANLDAELPDWDLAATRAAVEDAWRERLEVVRLTGGTVEQRRTFYTNLYHAFLMPTVIGDADGTYRLVGREPVVADGWRQMSDLSLWDTYRTVHPLYAWLAPESARDSVRSLTAFAQGLGAYPRWPVLIGESGVMLGSSAEIVVADAYLRGVPDVDAATAYPMLRAAAMDPVAPAGGRVGREHVEPYMQHGYVPASVGRSASTTTEYAHDDFALGNLALALGHPDDAGVLDARRRGWRMLFDESVGFLRARDPELGFVGDHFDPNDQLDDYAEANAWQSLWMAGAHDVDGLVELLGGVDGFVAKLTTFFEETRLDWENADAAAANFPRPYYWHGNEPDINAVYLFAQAGRPDLTQQWLRWLVDTLYDDTPAGLAGNDDGGTLGSWYVFSTLGLYPIPGSDRYVIGAPRFPQARIVVGGHELVIAAPDVSDENLYVRAVLLDGVPLDGWELTHQQLTSASELRFEMAATP